MKLAALAAALALAVPATAAAYTVTVAPSSPARGDAVVFTGSFPQAAFRQSRNPQFPNNPYGYVLCQDAAGVRVLDVTTVFFEKSRKLPDGSFEASSSPLVLDGPDWPADTAATCSISTGYWHQDKTAVVWNQVAWAEFAAHP